MYDSLQDFIQKNNLKITEGCCENVPEEKEMLKRYLDLIKPKSILEIGFNAGHSSEFFLLNSEATVISFDLGEHDYGKECKKYIDLRFPGRHTLILGDSTETLKTFADINPLKFDFIFINGGYHYNVALSDIIQCQRLAHPNSIVLVDDVVDKPDLQRPHTTGPSKVCYEWVHQKYFEFIEQKNFDVGRGLFVAKYTFLFKPPITNIPKKHMNKKNKKNINQKNKKRLQKRLQMKRKKRIQKN
jgi:predicted O-methyltransferase YrrM